MAERLTPVAPHLKNGAPSAHLQNGADHLDRDEVLAFPTTVAQQGFWFLDQLEPGNPAYNIAVRFRLQGPLNIETMEQALNRIVERHEVLRTTFANLDGQPVQVVAPTLSIALPVADLRNVPVANRHARSEELSVEEARCRFDLAAGPLIRARLLRLDVEDHVLLLTVHHIVSDGWSIGVIAHELGTLYGAIRRGEESSLADLSLQYGDFAVWEKEWLASGDLTGQLTYWTRRLANLPLLEVPTNRPRPAAPISEGHIESILLPKALTETLKALSQKEQSTFFMLALAALKILLQRATGQNDIFVGSLVAGRSQVELEPLIGPFINSLVLRTDLSGNPPFTELLARVRDTVVQALANQEVPFERVVEMLRPKRDLSRHPVYQINFIFQRDFVRPIHDSELTLTAIPSVSPGAIYDLNFFMVERADGWRASCEYNTHLYDAATVGRMLAEFQALLLDIAAHPGWRIDDMGRLTASRRDLLVPASTPTRQAGREDRADDAARPYFAPRDETEAKLARIWEQLLGVKQISVTADFFDAGGHSLLAAKLLARVERTFGRKLSLASLLQASTIRAFAIQLRAQSSAATNQLVFPIQPQGSRTPFFILTSQASTFYTPLAHRLGLDQPVFGLAWPELAMLPGEVTVSDIAANLVDALRDVQPHGPYYLGGWCMSGVVVYEMAQQLRLLDEEVAIAVVFDANNPRYVRSFRGLRVFPIRMYFRCQRWAYRLVKIRRMGLRAALGHVLSRISALSGHRRGAGHVRSGQARSDDVRRSLELQSRSAAEYDPKPYNGRLVLFRSAAYQTGRFRDPGLGWGEVARGGLDVIEIPGEHADMFVAPFVELLAKRLAEYLPQPSETTSASAVPSQVTGGSRSS